MLDSAAPTSLAALRSFLFAPASDLRRAQRALASPAHAAILDLEDAVADAEKADARDIVRSLLSQVSDSGKLDRPARLLRVNGAETPFFEGDLALLQRIDVDAVVLPKASVAALELLPERFPPVYALVESAAGLREAFALARSAHVVGLMLGAVDLAADLGLGRLVDSTELLFARSQLVRDSRAAGALAPIDGVWTQLDDPEGLIREAALACALGMRGKLCIHPRQLDVVHAAFAASEQERAWAQRVLDAYDTAVSRGEGAIALNGELVDLAVAERARRLLSEEAPR
ncbi:MAG: CoA ester lyase [Solirubrobacteraceae bacterium]